MEPQKIRQLGLGVETILGVHAKPRKLAELKAAVEDGRKKQNGASQPAR